MVPHDATRIPAMIDPDQVKRVARLSALTLNEDEVERMRNDLAEILSHVERISELDLSGVEPTAHVVSLSNVLRADVPRPSSPRDEMLASAPEPVEGAFRVPSTQAEA
jgi:aspartyl-tRNA(Asn)/glutamyl-tRNA(Gln) amidotransferase subunit C